MNPPPAPYVTEAVMMAGFITGVLLYSRWSARKDAERAAKLKAEHDRNREAVKARLQVAQPDTIIGDDHQPASRGFAGGAGGNGGSHVHILGTTARRPPVGGSNVQPAPIREVHHHHHHHETQRTIDLVREQEITQARQAILDDGPTASGSWAATPAPAADPDPGVTASGSWGASTPSYSAPEPAPSYSPPPPPPPASYESPSSYGSSYGSSGDSYSASSSSDSYSSSDSSSGSSGGGDW